MTAGRTPVAAQHFMPHWPHDNNATSSSHAGWRAGAGRGRSRGLGRQHAQHAAFATQAFGLTATDLADRLQQQQLEPQNGHEPVPASFHAPDGPLGQADAQALLLKHGAPPPPGYRLAIVLVPVELGDPASGGAKPVVP